MPVGPTMEIHHVFRMPCSDRRTESARVMDTHADCLHGRELQMGRQRGLGGRDRCCGCRLYPGGIGLHQLRIKNRDMHVGPIPGNVDMVGWIARRAGNGGAY